MDKQEQKRQLYEMLLQMKELAEQGKKLEIKILSGKFGPLYNSVFKIDDYERCYMIVLEIIFYFLISQEL